MAYKSFACMCKSLETQEGHFAALGFEDRAAGLPFQNDEFETGRFRLAYSFGYKMMTEEDYAKMQKERCMR